MIGIINYLLNKNLQPFQNIRWLKKSVSPQLYISANTEEAIGTFDGKTLYRKVYHNTGTWTSNVVLASLNPNNIPNVLRIDELYRISSGTITGRLDSTPTSSTRIYVITSISTSLGLAIQISGYTVKEYWITVIYTKN